MVQLDIGVVSSACSPTPLKVFPLLQGNLTHPSSIMFNLHAWALLGMGIEDRDSLGQSVPPSLCLAYDRKWDTLFTWCTERQIDHVSISLEDLGNFLLLLFEDLKLAASTVHV